MNAFLVLNLSLVRHPFQRMNFQPKVKIGITVALAILFEDLIHIRLRVDGIVLAIIQRDWKKYRKNVYWVIMEPYW